MLAARLAHSPNLSILHRRQTERLGPRTALRFKRDGLYRDVSWDNYRAAADACAAALIEHAVAPDDRVAILAENRIEWLIADIAILAAGAVTVPLHAPLVPEQVAYQLDHSDARLVFASGRHQLEKIAAVRDRLPKLEAVVVFDGEAADRSPFTTGGAAEHSPPSKGGVGGGRAFSWTAWIAQGRRALPACRTEIARREAARSRHDLATVIYTSGTTGNPKGVMLTHGNLLSNARDTLVATPLDERDVMLSWLPYSHIYARLVDHYLSILVGDIVCLAESRDTLLTNLAEIRPTVMTAVPRFYESVWGRVEHLDAPERTKKLHAIFGPRVRWLSSGGAPLPRHVAEGFLAAGIIILEGYGLTESSPVITFNRLEHFKLGTVGQAVPNVEVKLAPDGEILTRGPHVMRGYWKDPAATADAIDPEGWLHTGDVGRLDDEGFLTITDRKKDIIVLSTGKNVAPQAVERLLTADPCIEQAVVFGDKRPYLVALIVPCLPALRAALASAGIREIDAEKLADDDRVHRFFEDRVARCMQAVSAPERVRKFRLLARPFTIDADELTATLKVRRRKIAEKYAAELAQLYDEPRSL